MSCGCSSIRSSLTTTTTSASPLASLLKTSRRLRKGNHRAYARGQFLAGGVTEKVALNGSVLASIHVGGPGRTRTYTLPLLRRMRLPVAPLAHALGCWGDRWGDRRESNPCFQDHDLTGCHYTTITTITTIECWDPDRTRTGVFALRGRRARRCTTGPGLQTFVVDEGLQHRDGLHQVLRILHHGLDGLVR